MTAAEPPLPETALASAKRKAFWRLLPLCFICYVVAYVDRTNIRSGMAVRGGLLVSAFRSVGWQWGGRWTGTPDYQHFSATGG